MLTNEQKGQMFDEFLTNYTPMELLKRIESETDFEVLEVLNEVKKCHKHN